MSIKGVRHPVKYWRGLRVPQRVEDCMLIRGMLPESILIIDLTRWESNQYRINRICWPKFESEFDR
ncbi:MAG: hypothetical protein HJJLKODD_02623 [Phycisphaerae bacterium]|nr:hypothetical protein [Phycisphaerae bacterium]